MLYCNNIAYGTAQTWHLLNIRPIETKMVVRQGKGSSLDDSIILLLQFRVLNSFNYIDLSDGIIKS
jgi:hypothetical protein